LADAHDDSEKDVDSLLLQDSVGDPGGSSVTIMKKDSPDADDSFPAQPLVGITASGLNESRRVFSVRNSEDRSMID